MKYFISALVIGIVIIAAVLFLKPDEMKSVEGMWSKLINSENVNEEYKNVTELKKWIAEKNGFIEITAIGKNGTRVNVSGPGAEIEKDVNIRFQWKDQTFDGEHWNPKNKENVYAFFLE